MPAPDTATPEQAALMAVTLALGGHDGASFPADVTDLSAALGGQAPDWAETAGRLAGIAAALVVELARDRGEAPAALWARLVSGMTGKPDG